MATLPADITVGAGRTVTITATSTPRSRNTW